MATLALALAQPGGLRALFVRPGLIDLIGPAFEPAAAAVVEVQVREVLRTDAPGPGAVLLGSDGTDLLLPIFMESDEAFGIEQRLEHLPPGPPQSSDLVGATIRSLGGTLERVVIENADPLEARGRLYVSQGARQVDLAAPGPDSIAIALEGQVPIFVPQRLLSEAGLTREQVERLREPDAPAPPASPHGGGPFGEDPESHGVEL